MCSTYPFWYRTRADCSLLRQLVAGAERPRPSGDRSGPLSVAFTTGFEAVGHPLKTEIPAKNRALIEVYPPLALLEPERAPQRLPYKASRVRRYYIGRMPARIERRN